MPEPNDRPSVKDSRLGRIPQFDVRSFNFPIRASIAAEKIKTPRSFTWNTPDHFDQNGFGACVSFGDGYELSARPSEVQGLTNEFLIEQYFEIQRKDEFTGGEYPGANPRSGGTSLLAGAKHYRDLGYFKEFRHSFSMDDWILGTGYFGPAVTGFNWYENMMDTDSKGFVEPRGQLMGGHCTCNIGVNVRERYFLFPQSWKLPWGLNGEGYFKLRFSDAETLLHEQGEVMFFLGRKKLPKRKKQPQ